MDRRIIELSDMLETQSLVESECLPVDRYFLNKHLEAILSVDRKEFLLCNLERMNNTYTVQMMLCLPELWDDIDVDDLLKIVENFTNIFSYYSIIEFTHKYVGVNIIEMILRMTSLAQEIKNNIIDYLTLSFYPNLIKSEGDDLFFKEGLYGVQEDDWVYTRQKLLLDKRVKPALTDMGDLEKYVMSLIKYKVSDVSK